MAYPDAIMTTFDKFAKEFCASKPIRVDRHFKVANQFEPKVPKPDTGQHQLQNHQADQQWTGSKINCPGCFDASQQTQIHFSSLPYKDPGTQFSKLVQTTSVADYEVQFQLLATRIYGLTESFLMSRFINGLKDEIQCEVFAARPYNLHHAISLAKLWERKLLNAEITQMNPKHASLLKTLDNAYSVFDEIPGRDKWTKKVFICGYTQDEDCLCVATDDLWSEYYDNSVCNDVLAFDDEDDMYPGSEEEESHETQLQILPDLPDDYGLIFHDGAMDGIREHKWNPMNVMPIYNMVDCEENGYKQKWGSQVSGRETKVYAYDGLKSPPYKLDALEPFMRQRTLKKHLGEHHRGYVEGRNKQLEKNNIRYGYNMDELLKVTYNNDNPLPEFNNVAQLWNHDLFWESMQLGGGHQPILGLLQQIEKDFGSFHITNSREKFIEADLTLSGAGWIWIVLKKNEKQLAVVKTSNVINPIIWEDIPLISLDMWEHSYYFDYKNDKDGHVQFDKVLMGLLRRILGKNKLVQEADCSIFAILEEEVAKELVPRLDSILQHLMCTFGKYQRQNLIIVYDAIGTLSDVVGGELNWPMHLDILIPPLIEKWQQPSNADENLFKRLECFTSIAQTWGTGFSQFAQLVFQRCVNIIQTQHLAKVDHASADVQYDKEFLVCSLDLLSGLTEGLGSRIESLVSQSNLRDLLLQCCRDDAPDIRQSAFTLLRELARVCPVQLHPRLPEFLDVVAKELNTPKMKENVSVANNVCWAIGELAIKYGMKLTMFHGQGGTIERGGCPTHLAILSQSPETTHGSLRVTVQGEVLEKSFGEEHLCFRPLDVFVDLTQYFEAQCQEERIAEIGPSFWCFTKSISEWGVEDHNQNILISYLHFYPP